jgi:hypothetical protein
MAQAPRQTGGDGGADFIRHIVSDPKNVPDVMLLTGYLGASSEEGHERLYLSPDLTSYVEIPKAAILHQAPLPTEQDAHGGVTLWVKKDAALQYKMAPAAQALANYFAGAIQAGAQGAAPAAQQMPATLGGPVCGVTQPNVCQVVSAACTVFEPGCRTRQATCFVDCTVFGPACQSHFHTCPPCVINTPFCTQNRTPCPAASCGIDCTVVGPACQSIHVGTCILQCNPTRFQPECPFPTEVTCAPVCHQTFAQPCVASPAPACGPNITIGGCSVACFPGGVPGQPGPVARAAAAQGAAPAAQQITFAGPACGGSVGHFCSLFGPCDLWTTDTICCPIGNWTFDLRCPPTPVNPCITQVATCNAGGTCATPCLPTRFDPQCRHSIHVTCNPGCRFTNPALCQIATGACPGGQPGFGGQFGQIAFPGNETWGHCTRWPICAFPSDVCP